MPPQPNPSTDSMPELDGLSSADMAREITLLCGQIASATCRMLLLIAEFDRRKGWADWDCLSCSQWVSWRCGISLATAREHVRIARKLWEFPPLAQEFLKGKLTYSKVRAITRVATEDNLESLIEMASYMTAEQLSMVTATYRKVGKTIVAELQGRHHATRCLRYSYAEDGSLVIVARLAPEEGAQVIAALDAAMDDLERDERGTENPPADASGPRENPPADASGPRENQPADASAAPAGYERVREEDLIDPPNHALLASVMPEIASPFNRRAADALVAVCETYLEAGPRTRSGNDRFSVVVHVDEATLQGKDPEGLAEVECGPGLAPETVRRLSCDASISTLIERDGKPLSYGRKRRTVSPQLRRALAARDKKCLFPGCNRARWTEAHHIEHWIGDLGPTDPENLVLLCREHHRLVHEGGYKVELSPDGGFAVYRPAAVPITQVPPLPVVDYKDLMEFQKRLGVPAGSDSCVGNWDGEVIDLDSVISALLVADELHGDMDDLEARLNASADASAEASGDRDVA